MDIHSALESLRKFNYGSDELLNAIEFIIDIYGIDHYDKLLEMIVVIENDKRPLLSQMISYITIHGSMTNQELSLAFNRTPRCISLLLGSCNEIKRVGRKWRLKSG